MLAQDVELWERALRKLRARAMPPAGVARPGETAYVSIVSYLETELDRLAAVNVNPGRHGYLPTSHAHRVPERRPGSPIPGCRRHRTAAARRRQLRVSTTSVRSAVTAPDGTVSLRGAKGQSPRGRPVGLGPDSHVVVLPVDLTQEDHFDGLPFGTRGGAAVIYNFPLDGEYQLQVRLSRNRNENVEGLTESHVMEITLDGERLELLRSRRIATGSVITMPTKMSTRGCRFGYRPRLGRTQSEPRHQEKLRLDRNRATVVPGPLQHESAPADTAAVRSVSITGPFDATGAGETRAASGSSSAVQLGLPGAGVRQNDRFQPGTPCLSATRDGWRPRGPPRLL